LTVRILTDVQRNVGADSQSRHQFV